MCAGKVHARLLGGRARTTAPSYLTPTGPDLWVLATVSRRLLTANIIVDTPIGTD